MEDSKDYKVVEWENSQWAMGIFPLGGLRERKDCEVSHCNMMGKFTNREKELVIRGSGKFPNIIILEISRTILTIFTLYLMGYIIYLYF